MNLAESDANFAFSFSEAAVFELAFWKRRSFALSTRISSISMSFAASGILTDGISDLQLTDWLATSNTTMSSSSLSHFEWQIPAQNSEVRQTMKGNGASIKSIRFGGKYVRIEHYHFKGNISTSMVRRMLAFICGSSVTIITFYSCKMHRNS